jgi:hypothetical protein
MPKTDSIISAEERAKAIRAEAAKIAKEEAERAEMQAAHQARQAAKAREIEIDDIAKEANRLGLLGEIQTRDQLLARILAMREEKVAAPAPEPPMNPTREAEEALGRAQVAKFEVLQEQMRERRRRAEAEEQARAGMMQPVVHPNPGMNQEFPAQKATLGKQR